MDVGIGIPNTVPGTTGDQLIEFARKAEEAGFSTLGTIDRMTYPNMEPLVALAAAAAVTERVTLATTIAIAPMRENAVLLAKQAATVQRISNGRLRLGIAAGGREDDYKVSKLDFESRYKRFEEMVEELRDTWARSNQSSGEPGLLAVGPDVADNPPQLVLGGSTEHTFRRVAKYADGWIMGGGTPQQFAESRKGVEAAWQEAGREGTPYMGALAYFALGDDAESLARNYLGDYYRWLGDYAEQIIGSAAKDADTVKAYLQAFADAGCQELIWFPASPDPRQVELLAEAAF